MNPFRYCLLLMALAGCSMPLFAQSISGYGWSSFGVLPFPGVDFVIAQAPTQYILYYTQVVSAGEFQAPTPGRAFSTDLKNWTVDPNDVCSTSGDLCAFNNRKNITGIMNLPDGRLRLFAHTGGLSSMISSDGITWTLESGVRFTPDTSSIYEQGQYALAFTSFVPLPDGSVRMYYEGGVTPGFPGTPAYYNSMFYSGVILSALSRDNGLTWVRDPGVRINPLVQGPVNLVAIAGTIQNQIDCSDFSAVGVAQNGRNVVRVFCSANSTVSYISTDGLNFALEGEVPADFGDPKAIVMPDGRIWLLTNQYPNGIDDTIVYGPQSLFLNAVQADVGSTPPIVGIPNPFQSVSMGVTGTSNGPVTLAAIDGPTYCPTAAACLVFHPEYYSFSPASGNPPFTTVVSYTGPSDPSPQVVIHATSANAVAVGNITCMKAVLNRGDYSAFFESPIPALPMNQMNFSFFCPNPARAPNISHAPVAVSEVAPDWRK